MSFEPNRILRIVTSIIFGVILLSVIGLIGLAFYKTDSKMKSKSEIIPYPIATIWQVLVDRSIYLQTKKEIMSYQILESNPPHWTEVYGPKDTIDNICIQMKPKTVFNYQISIPKYEQMSNIYITLDSLSSTQTRITVSDSSIYHNTWGNIYFQYFHPTTVIDYELVKIKNSIQSISTISK